MRDSLPRRRKLGDPFAAPSKIKALLDQLLQRLAPQLTEQLSVSQLQADDYHLLIQLLQRASHFIRTGESNSARASKRFLPELLSLVITELSDLLTVESQNRISFRTFTDNNLRVLDCPSDIKEWLETGQITLFEALQLKRLSTENLSANGAIGDQSAARLRAQFLQRYRSERWLAHRLRHEIDAHLGKKSTPVTPASAVTLPSAAPAPAQPANPIIAEVAQLKAVPNSIFGEQIALMIELLQTLDPNQLSNDEMEQLLNNVDEVLLQLQQLSRKKSAKSTQNEKTPNLGVC